MIDILKKYHLAKAGIVNAGDISAFKSKVESVQLRDYMYWSYAILLSYSVDTFEYFYYMWPLMCMQWNKEAESRGV